MKPEKFDPKEKKRQIGDPRTVGKKNRDMRDAKITQKESSRPIKKASVIRDQAKIFQDPRFFKVPFFTPTCRSHFDCSLSSLK